MAYRSGLKALQDSIKAADERAKAAQSGGFGSALGYFAWQPGDRKILRFLDDDVIIDNFWNFVISNTGSPITFLVDPEDPDRLKRYMSPTPGIGWKKESRPARWSSRPPPSWGWASRCCATRSVGPTASCTCRTC